MENTYSYKAQARWTMHKRGILEVADIPRTINFAAPPEFGGEPGLWTPEHLLLGAVVTCYIATFRAIAESSNLAINGMDVQIDGRIEKQEGGFRFSQIGLHPSVTVGKPEDIGRARRLMEKAERICLVSRSLSCPVTLEVNVQAAELVAAH